MSERMLERDHDRFRVEVDEESVYWLVMEQRDEPANVMTPPMLNAMLDVLNDIEDDASCLVLAGEGNFSAGADLRKLRDVPPEMRPAIIESFSGASNRVIKRLRSFPAPVVAAVSGKAAGGGVGLALASDFIFMHEDAVLDPAYLQLGLSPDAATTFYLTLTVGPYQAREILFGPEPLSATSAKDLGLATRVFDGTETEFFEQISEAVQQFAHGPTATYKRTKLLTDEVFDELVTHLERERDTIRRISDTETFSEGLDAFFEGREPEWRNGST